MEINRENSIFHILTTVPQGSLKKIRYEEKNGLFSPETEYVPIDGKGLWETWSVCAGITASFYSFAAERYQKKNLGANRRLTIFHSGESGIRLGKDSDTLSFPAGTCGLVLTRGTEETMIFPAHRHQGIQIEIDLDRCTDPLHPLLMGANPDFKRLIDAYNLKAGIPVGLDQRELSDALDSVYRIDPAVRGPFIRLKALEILLWLCAVGTSGAKDSVEMATQLQNTVREIHDCLMTDLGTRITIEELSRRYLMNPTTLKAAFKAVYGNSIAAHMKEHRMERAAYLLEQSDDPVSCIAKMVGYGNQSKFTSAFKEVYHMLPTEYRKERRGGQAKELREKDESSCE